MLSPGDADERNQAAALGEPRKVTPSRRNSKCVHYLISKCNHKTMSDVSKQLKNSRNLANTKKKKNIPFNMEKLPPVSLMKLKMKKSPPSVKIASIFIKTLFIFSQLKAFVSFSVFSSFSNRPRTKAEVLFRGKNKNKLQQEVHRSPATFPARALPQPQPSHRSARGPASLKRVFSCS